MAPNSVDASYRKRKNHINRCGKQRRALLAQSTRTASQS